jgi:hypothetical protein
MKIVRALGRPLGLALAGGVALVLWAAPAGAQQLVDAGKQGDGSGGLAFVLFAGMAAVIAASLFFMDRVRRNRLRDEEDVTPRH